MLFLRWRKAGNFTKISHPLTKNFNHGVFLAPSLPYAQNSLGKAWCSPLVAWNNETDTCEHTCNSCCLLSLEDIKAKQEPRSWTAGVWQHSLKNLATLIQVLASFMNFIQRPEDWKDLCFGGRQKLLLSYSEESILQVIHRDALNSLQGPVFPPSGIIQIIVKIHHITDKGSEYNVTWCWSWEVGTRRVCLKLSGQQWTLNSGVWL